MSDKKNVKKPEPPERQSVNGNGKKIPDETVKEEPKEIERKKK